MKRAFLLLVLLVLVSFCPDVAKAAFTISFDENGNASVSIYGGSSFTETGFMAADHSGAFPNTQVLTYALPETVGSGGVNILDPSGAISDNLYFYDNGGNGYMEFLSQTGGGALADTGVTNFGVTGATEQSDGTFSFVAGGGDPAYTNFYNGIVSTPVPEPTSLALFGLTTLAGAGFFGWRRRKQPAQA